MGYLFDNHRCCRYDGGSYDLRLYSGFCRERRVRRNLGRLFYSATGQLVLARYRLEVCYGVCDVCRILTPCKRYVDNRRTLKKLSIDKTEGEKNVFRIYRCSSEHIRDIKSRPHDAYDCSAYANRHPYVFYLFPGKEKNGFEVTLLPAFCGAYSR